MALSITKQPSALRAQKSALHPTKNGATQQRTPHPSLPSIHPSIHTQHFHTPPSHTQIVIRPHHIIVLDTASQIRCISLHTSFFQKIIIMHSTGIYIASSLTVLSLFALCLFLVTGFLLLLYTENHLPQLHRWCKDRALARGPKDSIDSTIPTNPTDPIAT